MTKTCPRCNIVNNKTYNYCKNCGQELTSLNTKMKILTEKVKQKTLNTIDQVKIRLDDRIKIYLKQLENDKQVKIGRVLVPENKRKPIQDALLSFQGKLGLKDEANNVQEFEKWYQALPKRLDLEKCIVCFASWTSKDDTIVVCKHCGNGGHKNHMINWLKTKNFCPLCRLDLNISNLIQINIE